ncbi:MULTISPECIES: hypothetical protein [unclassified Devosia]|jgi:hypothetical protein|uniref:hypothetical protein n=1 Tax=unclassified Devosia TaxID=196773 RepID=UPI00086DC3E0|nr:MULTISPECIES: hypothetical protein [unclassified Devosia]MBN9361785.1 hypothetical protein [Devosia sp.]ODS87600.1 MAG: hypothetical protein ABS47_11715 [Devosia sp. SCN 66-27]OJX26809.1 MAG: hypothetical protein BGO83_23500 [Devosia sp. 66-14]
MTHKIIQLAERLRAKVTRKGKDLVPRQSEFDFPAVSDEGAEDPQPGKKLDNRGDFDITEIPALTVWQYVVITVIVTVASGLAVIVIAKALGF